MLKAIGKLIIALNGNIKKSQIAAGIAWGALLGLIPAGNFFWIVLFIVSFFFRHHHWSKILGMTIVKLISPLFILAVDALGWRILHIGSLQGFFTLLYNMPFAPFTKFNNTLVMGGITGGFLLWIPVYFSFLYIVSVYRSTIAPVIRNSKIVKSIAKSPFLKLIENIFFKGM